MICYSCGTSTDIMGCKVMHVDIKLKDSRIVQLKIQCVSGQR
jgi:hypothetical protein